MKQRRSYKTGVFIILLLLGILGLWGCTREIFESPQVPAEKPQQQIPRWKPTSSRFGAVHHTYADVYAQPDAESERLTQCIYGDVVRIEYEYGGWYSVKIGPYPELSGWMYKAALAVLPSDSLYIRERTLTTIVIRQDVSDVFIWPSTTMKIVMGTELPFIAESGEWYLVRLPSNDVGRIPINAVYPSAVPEPLICSKQEPILIPQKILQQRRDIVDTAQRFLGKVYIWGGTTPRGFDCSGLSYFVYKLNGIELPRVSWLQFRSELGQEITQSELEQADLVFFQTYKRGPSHVGIYIGNNQFIHASPKYGVNITNLENPYFKRRYIGAKTVFSPS